MQDVLEILKLADFPAPQPQQVMPPAPAPAAKPDPKPMPVQGSAFKAPTVTPAAGGSGSFTVQHPGPGGTAIDTGQVSEQQQQLAEQSQQLQEQEQKMVEQQNHMNEQRMADMQTTMAMTVDQQKNTQDQLKKHTDQWMKSMSDRLSVGGGKVASIFDGPLRADTPSGRLPSPEYAQPDWVPDGALGSLLGAGRKALFGNLWNQYAPKPLGAVSDINSRFGRNYFDAAGTIGRLSEKAPTGLSLLANLAGGLATKYMGGGDYSNVGTDATKFINQATPLLNP